MSQVQLKVAPVAVTISCSHCEQEQVVHIRARTGSWLMAHQSVRCVRCDQCFDVMISDAIIAGPFLPIDTAAPIRKPIRHRRLASSNCRIGRNPLGTGFSTDDGGGLLPFRWMVFRHPSGAIW
jgi:hypothetical protein